MLSDSRLSAMTGMLKRSAFAPLAIKRNQPIGRIVVQGGECLIEIHKSVYYGMYMNL